MRFQMLNENTLMEMANLRGKDVKIEDINFSIYFSPKQTDQYSIRIKILWNREKMNSGKFDGILYMHGDYEYRQSLNADNKPDKFDILELQYFAKRYKTIFAAVWENKLDPNDVEDYFKGRVSFKELLNLFLEISYEDKQKIKKANSLKELTQIIKENNIFNLWE